MSLFGSLEVGKSGVNASKSGQHTTGHNIANVDTPGYSRQQTNQSAFVTRNEGLRNGVSVDSVRRFQDQFTHKKLIEQTNLAEHWKARSEVLSHVETELVGPQGETLSRLLSDFWSGWETLSASPEDLSVRRQLLQKSSLLADGIRRSHQSVSGIRKEIGKEIELELDRVNLASKRIAKLNKIIQNLEARKGNPNDFRDERDRLVKQIGESFDVAWYEDEKNHVNIQVGSGYSIVEGVKSYDMELYGDFKEPSMQGAGIRLGKQLLFDLTESVKTGKAPALIEARDVDLKNYADFLNELSGELADRVNQIHSGATGLEVKHRMDATAKIIPEAERSQPLRSVQSGSAEIHVFNNEGELERTLELKFEEGVSAAEDLVNQINEQTALPPSNAGEVADPAERIPKLTAKFNAEGRIELTGSPYSTFALGEDETGAFAAVGFNGFFFNGGDAASFKVNPALERDPKLVSGGYEGNPGDNRAALSVYALKNELTMNQGLSTFRDAHEKVVGDLGMQILEAEEKGLYHESARGEYQAISDSVSGVSLDEELVNMTRYQRAYDASAKFISTVDEMTQTLINM